MIASTIKADVRPLRLIPTSEIPQAIIDEIAALPEGSALPTFGPFNLYDMVIRLAKLTTIDRLRITTWRIDPAAAFALRDALLDGHIRAGELWIGLNASAKTLEGAEAANAHLSDRFRVLRTNTHAKVADIRRAGHPPLSLFSSCNLQLNIAGQSSFTFVFSGKEAAGMLDKAFAQFAAGVKTPSKQSQLNLDLTP